ncbi:MAG: SDR family oxidoreductase [Alphaproteobacteria bacterium]|nr:SDR family oxidoreductase [Alphaproteobacteria bacterium]
MTQISPRTVLITGAARRVGREIALDMARQGWNVAIHYHRSADAAAEVAQTIKDFGGNAATIGADLSQESEVVTVVPRAVAALGAVGCLINNASLFERDEWDVATRASWEAHMEVNLRAPFVLTQAFAKQLSDECCGAVINVIDQRVWNLTPHFTSYTLSKAGLWTLTQTLALALAPGIRVNAIGPGPALPSARQTKGQFDRQWRTTPLRHGTSPQEIAEAVRFILAAPAMTGQMLALDGGQHLGWAQPEDGEGPEE